jgi:hypothetical protein
LGVNDSAVAPKLTERMFQAQQITQHEDASEDDDAATDGLKVHF